MSNEGNKEITEHVTKKDLNSVYEILYNMKISIENSITRDELSTEINASLYKINMNMTQEIKKLLYSRDREIEKLDKMINLLKISFYIISFGLIFIGIFSSIWYFYN